jgi:membrane protease YdiL (CAAX protease family)
MQILADRSRYRSLVGGAVVAAFVASAAVLAVTGTAYLRYSADHDRTVGLWEIALPVAVGLLVARFAPPGLPVHRPEPVADRPGREARACVALAVGFAISVLALEQGYVVLKIGFLALAPTLVLTHRSWLVGFPQRSAYGRWWWAGPVAAAGAWFALAWVGPFARSTTAELGFVALAVGLAFNAYLEERFYRGWLQTRLEHVCGRWTAIGLASLLWAAWHVAIHGTGRPLVDVATVIAHLGVLGLLLGYLWARFRNPWPLLAIHGAVNTPLQLLATVWP